MTPGWLLALGIGIVVAWFALDVLLVLFAGVLFAIFVRALAALLSRATGLGETAAVAVVGLALLALAAATGMLLSNRLTAQFVQLVDDLPRALERLRVYVEAQPWGQAILARTPPPTEMIRERFNLWAATTGTLSITTTVLVMIVVVLFVGAYLAAQPTVYRHGALRLVPLAKRHRVDEVLDEAGSMLRWWLAGKLLSMALIGVATGIGLTLLGIPAAAALGILTALLTFIPNFGPVLSALPAVLLAFVQSPTRALWVALLYTGIQLVETYVITPIVQAKTVSLPPGLTIAAQIMLGLAAGLVGLLLATPLVIVALVVVRRLYVEDVLGDDLATPP